MRLTFIPVIEADRDFFVHVHHVAYRKTIEKQFGWNEKEQDDFANKAFDSSVMNIIKMNNYKVGVVAWREFPDYFWLEEVFILPEFQNRGIGTEILSTTKEKAREAGKSIIKLQTLKANLDAKRLYERQGFVLTEATQTHWKFSAKV